MQKKPWSISAKAGGAIEILLYDQIGADFFGEGTSAKDFANDLKAQAPVSQINLRINSPGGNVFDGLAIYNTLLNHGAKITATVDGIAASIASVIAMAASELSMAETSILMIHNPHTVAMGDSAAMRKLAETMDTVKASMVNAYQRHTKLSAEEIGALMDDETWMSAEEAQSKGFANSIIKQPAIAASFDLSKFQHVPTERLEKMAASADIEVPAAVVAAQSLLQQPVIQAVVPATAGQEKPVITEEQKPEPVVVAKESYNETAAEIIAVGRKYKVPTHLTEAMIRNGVTLDKAIAECANWYLANQANQAHTSGLAQSTVDGMSNEDKGRFSIVKAIRALADDSSVDAKLEREVSDSIAKACGIPTRGIYVPTNLRGVVPNGIRAGLDTKTGAAGGYGVQTSVQEMIELLRNRLLVIQLGATMLTGLKDNLAFPVKTSGSSGSWVSQNPGSDVADSDATFGQKTMSPKTFQATTAFSRQFLAQGSIDVEAMVRDDLAKEHARAVDAAAINGPGTSNAPLGLLNTTGIGSVAMGTNGAAPDYTTVVDLETAIANANADVAGMKYLTTPTMRGKLRKTQQFATTNGLPVWQQLGNSLGVGDVLGYPGYVSKQVPSTLTKGSNSDCHAIIFGSWPELLIGEWGVLEVVVDPYRLKKQNLIEVTSFQMVDILVRQPAEFAACLDARNV